MSTSRSERANRRWGWLLSSCLLTVVALTALIIAHHQQSRAPRSWLRRAESKLEKRFAEWHRLERPVGTVVLFGDSLNLCRGATSTRSRSVGDEMMRAVRESGGRYQHLDLSHPGLQPLHFYGMLGRLPATADDIVLVEVNLRGFRLPNPVPRAARFLPLMRDLDIRQSWHARRDLWDNGIGVADPSIMKLKERLGILDPLETARRSAIGWLDAIAGLVPWSGRPQDVASRRGRRHRMTYLVDYGNHPKADTLRAMVRELRETGASVLVYLAPIDVEGLARRGLDRAELQQRFVELREAIGVSPAEWLDLHDALSSDLFRDEHNHLLPPGCELVGRALARRVIAHRTVVSSPSPK